MKPAHILSKTIGALCIPAGWVGCCASILFLVLRMPSIASVIIFSLAFIAFTSLVRLPFIWLSPEDRLPLPRRKLMQLTSALQTAGRYTVAAINILGCAIILSATLGLHFKTFPRIAEDIATLLIHALLIRMVMRPETGSRLFTPLQIGIATLCVLASGLGILMQTAIIRAHFTPGTRAAQASLEILLLHALFLTTLCLAFIAWAWDLILSRNRPRPVKQSPACIAE